MKDLTKWFVNKTLDAIDDSQLVCICCQDRTLKKALYETASHNDWLPLKRKNVLKLIWLTSKLFLPDLQGRLYWPKDDEFILRRLNVGFLERVVYNRKTKSVINSHLCTFIYRLNLNFYSLMRFT
jgi:hypothetical protein